MGYFAEIYTGYYGTKEKPADYKVISCLLLDKKTGEVVSRGIAICSPKDQLDKKYGQTLAKDRAAISLQDSGIYLSDFHKWHPRIFNMIMRISPWPPRLGEQYPKLFTSHEQSAIDAWRRKNLKAEVGKCKCACTNSEPTKIDVTLSDQSPRAEVWA